MANWILVALLVLLPASAQALEGLRLGDKAPAFSLAGLTGKVYSLDDMGERPRVVLFWSSWSPRSLEVLRDFRAIHERWSAAGLAVVAVNADAEHLDPAGLQSVRDCVERLELPFPVLLDEGLRTSGAYGILALPSTVVIDAHGRIVYALGGYPETLREELQERIATAVGGGGTERVVVRDSAPAEPPVKPAETEDASRCTLPRAFYCTMALERHSGTADPAVVAVRLAICRGSADEAERMLQGVGREAAQSVELRFARGSLLLLRGLTVEARESFSALRGSDSAGSWGEWGLGMTALAEGNSDEALDHMRAAVADGRILPEAETAVLKYLEEFWRSDRTSPREEQFLALFPELGAVRACYKKLGALG